MTELLLGCLKIFICRICDVTLSTMRTMLTVKGKPLYASMIGFAEAFIYYIVVKDALTADGNVVAIGIAYGLGFAAGTYLGGRISNIVIKTNVMVQVITTSRNQQLLDVLRDHGYAITVLRIEHNEYGPEKYMVMCNMNKKLAPGFEKLVRSIDQHAFVVISDTRSSHGGYRPQVK